MFTGSKPVQKPGSRITKHFEATHKLVEGQPGAMQIDVTLRAIAQIKSQLQTMGGGLGDKGALDALSGQGQADALDQLRQESLQLPAPLAQLVAQIGSQGEAFAKGEANKELANRYQTEVASECRQLLSNRYPFSTAGNDVGLADFGRLFAPNGLFDSFYRTRLAALVDDSRKPWRWREGAGAIGGSSGLLSQFQNVEEIRQMYFAPGANAPEVRFTLTPESLDAAVRRLVIDIDGQPVEYRHGPPRAVAVQWPGPSPGPGVDPVRGERWLPGPTSRSAEPGRCSACSNRRRSSRRRMDALCRHLQRRRAQRAADAGGELGPQPVRPQRAARLPLRRLRAEAVSHSRVGFFGKLPGLGDFIERDFPPALRQVWDDWLQRGLAESQRALGDTWLDTYLTSPIWRFFLHEGVAGAASYAGIMMPSVDRVGRYFPLTVAAELGNDVLAMRLASAGAPWFEAVERHCMDVLRHAHVTVEQFTAGLAHTEGLLANANFHERGAAPLSSATQWRFALRSAQHVAPALEAPVSLAAQNALRPLTMWWTDGSERMGPSVLLVQSLPRPRAFAAMLGGRLG